MKSVKTQLRISPEIGSRRFMLLTLLPRQLTLVWSSSSLTICLISSLSDSGWFMVSSSEYVDSSRLIISVFNALPSNDDDSESMA